MLHLWLSMITVALILILVAGDSPIVPAMLFYRPPPVGGTAPPPPGYGGTGGSPSWGGGPGPTGLTNAPGVAAKPGFFATNINQSFYVILAATGVPQQAPNLFVPPGGHGHHPRAQRHKHRQREFRARGPSAGDPHRHRRRSDHARFRDHLAGRSDRADLGCGNCRRRHQREDSGHAAVKEKCDGFFDELQTGGGRGSQKEDMEKEGQKENPAAQGKRGVSKAEEIAKGGTRLSQRG